jgi:hypothetical protein
MNITRLIFLLPVFIILSSCQNAVRKNSLTPEQQANLLSKGKMITEQSFKALSGEVINAINKGGLQHAVDYCNLQASPLIDSLSEKYDAKISRVSDRYRNPQNKPGELDFIVMQTYQRQLAEGSELQAHLEITADEVVFYSPILILNPACLNCHGEPGSTMEQANLDFIKSKYPEDLATGYKLGDLRGLWKIVMSSEF